SYVLLSIVTVILLLSMVAFIIYVQSVDIPPYLRWLLGLVVFAALVTLVMGFLTGRRLIVKIREITRLAEAVSGGQYTFRAPLQPDDEMGVVAATFNRLAEEIATKVETITEEEAQF